jgi:uncharacterized membrane protein YccC
MATGDVMARMGPYLERLVENGYAQDNLRDATANLRAAYERASKRRVKATRDEKIRRQLRNAAQSLSEATKALMAERKRSKGRRAKRLLIVLGIVALGAGVALAASGDLRNKLLGEEPETPPSSDVTPAAPGPPPA